MTKYYAGIGSRDTPGNVLTRMGLIARALDKKGLVLRSGGARGADAAFQQSTENWDIYIPADCTPEAMEMASKYHPAWGRCNNYVRKLHGRNCQILLGMDLDTPVEFIVCWTPGGRITGGTGMALRMAKHQGIPVYNLAINGRLEELRKLYRDM